MIAFIGILIVNLAICSYVGLFFFSVGRIFYFSEDKPTWVAGVLFSIAVSFFLAIPVALSGGFSGG